MTRAKKGPKPPRPIRCWRTGCDGTLVIKDGARVCTHCKVVVRGGK